MAQPTPEQAKEILDTLRAELATLPTRALRIARIQELMKRLDIKVETGDADLVLNRFIQGGRITPVDVSGAAPGPGGVGTVAIPTALPAPSPDVRDVQQQRELFSQQDQGELFRRGLGTAFGRPSSEFTPAAQRAAASQFGRFQEQRPITSFFDPSGERGAQFSSFLGTPDPTRSGLNQQINNILQGQAGGDPALQARFRSSDFFSTPEQVASLARQPILAELAPRLRGGVANVLEQQSASRFAENPEQFQSPDDLIRLLQDFASRGFLNLTPETLNALAPTQGGVTGRR